MNKENIEERLFHEKLADKVDKWDRDNRPKFIIYLDRALWIGLIIAGLLIVYMRYSQPTFTLDAVSVREGVEKGYLVYDCGNNTLMFRPAQGINLDYLKNISVEGRNGIK